MWGPHLVEELIKVGHLKQYVCVLDRQDETKVTKWAPPSPATPRAVINYIHGEPVDDKYHSKRQRRMLVRTTSIRERVHVIQFLVTDKSVQLINVPITFPPLTPTE